MFTFVGDTVLDPFSGTASTSVGAARWGRNSVAIELDPVYSKMGHDRLKREASGLFTTTTIEADA
jgi:DNA modification methylase